MSARCKASCSVQSSPTRLVQSPLSSPTQPVQSSPTQPACSANPAHQPCYPILSPKTNLITRPAKPKPNPIKTPIRRLPSGKTRPIKQLSSAQPAQAGSRLAKIRLILAQTTEFRPPQPWRALINRLPSHPPDYSLRQTKTCQPNPQPIYLIYHN